jgi:hypothetical protein
MVRRGQEVVLSLTLLLAPSLLPLALYNISHSMCLMAPKRRTWRGVKVEQQYYAGLVHLLLSTATQPGTTTASSLIPIRW